MLQQHKKEILDLQTDYQKVLSLSFNKEFLNMLYICIFVPFLHKETPRPLNVAKIPYSKNVDHSLQAQIARVLEIRQKAVDAQRKGFKTSEVIL